MKNGIWGRFRVIAVCPNKMHNRVILHRLLPSFVAQANLNKFKHALIPHDIPLIHQSFIWCWCSHFTKTPPIIQHLLFFFYAVLWSKNTLEHPNNPWISFFIFLHMLKIWACLGRKTKPFIIKICAKLENVVFLWMKLLNWGY